MIKRVFSISLLAFILPSFAFSQTDIELVYQSLLGGNGFEGILGVAELANDSIIVYGDTESTNLEMIGSFQGNNQGGKDSFVAILASDGVPILTSYLGGSGDDIVNDIAISSDSDIYLVGGTVSADFPVFNSDSDVFGGNRMGFITKINSDFDVEYSLLVGGEGVDDIFAIDIDEAGNFYVVGITRSPGLGTSGTLQPELVDPEITSGFVAKYSPDGEKLWYTYVEGSDLLFLRDVKILPNEGSLITFGYTVGEIPMESTGHQPEFGGGQDCILFSFDSEMGTLNWFTYYGGESEEFASSIAIDEEENVYISGDTGSNENISSFGSFQEIHNGFGDYFVAKFSSSGERAWGTYFGASSIESRTKLSRVQNGEFYMTGRTMSETGLTLGTPILESVDIPMFASASCLAKFSTDGDLIWSTYAPESYPCGFFYESILIDTKLYIAGAFGENSNPECFGLTPDAYQTVHGGGFRDFGIFIYEENSLSTSFPHAEPLSIYPNPAQDHVTIEASNLLWAGMDLTVTDISGRQVDRIARFQSGNTYSTGHLSEGVYILTGQIGERMFRQKLVVQR
jgi:hypothetical protein